MRGTTTRRVRAQVERRPHRLVAAEPAAHRRQRDDPRRDQPDRRIGQVGEQRLEPAGRRHHVGVEEGDERGRRRREPGVARGGRAARARVAQHAGAGLRRDRTQGVGIGGAVVDDDHAAQVRREGGQQPGDGAGPVLDRDDDGDLLRPGPAAPSGTGCATPLSSSRLASARDVGSVTAKPPPASSARPAGASRSMRGGAPPSSTRPPSSATTCRSTTTRNPSGRTTSDGPAPVRGHTLRCLDHAPIVTR